MYKYRWLAKLRARLEGWFWLPCPVCGEYFAGFETGKYSKWLENGRGKCVCSKDICQLYAYNDPHNGSHSK